MFLLASCWANVSFSIGAISFTRPPLSAIFPSIRCLLISVLMRASPEDVFVDTRIVSRAAKHWPTEIVGFFDIFDKSLFERLKTSSFFSLPLPAQMND